MQEHMGNERAYAYYNKIMLLIFSSSVAKDEYMESKALDAKSNPHVCQILESL